MTEKDPNIEKDLDYIEGLVARTKESVILEAMWDPSILDPEIHLSEDELGEFIKTFSEDKEGQQAKAWIEGGIDCDEAESRGEKRIPCKNLAAASIEFSGVTFSGSLLVCRDHIRSVYANLKSVDVKTEGLFPNLRINGKELPKLKAA